MKRVLVVDDSSFMRRSLTHLLESDDAIKVVGTASDGAEALHKVRQLRPDVVILDIEMAVMNGLLALTHIMTELPTPVLVLTGLHGSDATISIRCLAQGAVDVIRKPSGVISYDVDRLRPEIIAKVKMAAALNARQLVPPCRARPAASGARIIVIGASTGGPQAVAAILPALPTTLGASVLVVQHMSSACIAYFAAGLQTVCAFDVGVAREDEEFIPGRVVVSPGDCHTLVTWTGEVRRVKFSRTGSPHAVYPSVDYAMASAAEAYGAGAIGVLLTGIGSDGARGMKAIKAAGGTTLAEDPATCFAPGMPRAAIDLRCIDQVLPLSLMAPALAEMI